MNITVSNMKRDTSTGTITTVYWLATSAVNGSPVYSHGSVDLDSPGENFIPYSEVTEANVQAWLATKLDLAGIEATLLAAPTAVGCPWQKSL